ncbi:cryptochrome/photolyase family protein [Brevundimonas halotolerans]|uniref:Deoxyribodipyrimidine photo-lyase n=1 Tax=Brevundimonas halotolerans TaxID=69670 RepID=A0A7W9A1X1_9CAUL|nr:deoxyribodipyrimidine photo-lyase [Brevundimonas halotolerans]MBB5659655.1 deoxyribodipyrimidine photo-lyase [Brevundimonas halotolerans]
MSGTDAPVILWFRRDLRLADNPALTEAVASGRPVMPLYVLDEAAEGRPLGGASKWWLERSLQALAEALDKAGAPLILKRGPAEAVLRALIEETGAKTVFMNRRFEPAAFAADADIAHALKAEGIECRGFNGSLLARPGSVLTQAEKPYKVFTPFYRALMEAIEPPPARPAPERIAGVKGVASDPLEDWGLYEARPDWAARFDAKAPGEAAASKRLADFIRRDLANYGVMRDRPGKPGTSRLSAALHWGEISPWRVVLDVRAAVEAGTVTEQQAEAFVREIGWREFSAHLLHQFPTLPDRNFQPKFDDFPWRSDGAGLKAWQAGQTGYPMVDAGMRELWTTGWMHNRVRMVVASFLVKHLRIDWREGESWFWDTLIDADLASNSQNWQWVAGSGADAAPYFRIFNPVSQGTKFDADGEYVRRWVPELKKLPDRWLHSPWEAPAEVRADAGVQLGKTYPRPIVDHAEARDAALAAFKSLGNEG